MTPQLDCPAYALSIPLLMKTRSLVKKLLLPPPSSSSTPAICLQSNSRWPFEEAQQTSVRIQACDRRETSLRRNQVIHNLCTPKASEGAASTRSCGSPTSAKKTSSVIHLFFVVQNFLMEKRNSNFLYGSKADGELINLQVRFTHATITAGM